MKIEITYYHIHKGFYYLLYWFCTTLVFSWESPLIVFKYYLRQLTLFLYLFEIFLLAYRIVYHVSGVYSSLKRWLIPECIWYRNNVNLFFVNYSKRTLVRNLSWSDSRGIVVLFFIAFPFSTASLYKYKYTKNSQINSRHE